MLFPVVGIILKHLQKSVTWKWVNSVSLWFHFNRTSHDTWCIFFYFLPFSWLFQQVISWSLIWWTKQNLSGCIPLHNGMLSPCLSHVQHRWGKGSFENILVEKGGERDSQMHHASTESVWPSPCLQGAGEAGSLRTAPPCWKGYRSAHSCIANTPGVIDFTKSTCARRALNASANLH